MLRIWKETSGARHPGPQCDTNQDTQSCEAGGGQPGLNNSASAPLATDGVVLNRATLQDPYLTSEPVSCASDIHPPEVVILYDALLPNTESRLMEALHEIDPEESSFTRTFRAAHYALVEVGLCASDLIWRRAIREYAAHRNDDDDPAFEIANKIRDLVKNWVFAMPNLNLSSRGFNVTPKFVQLIHVLKSCGAYGDNFRGIVLVQWPEVATIIVDIMRTMIDELGFIRPYALASELLVTNNHEQCELLDNFASGKYNLLVMTKALEDVDLPRAHVVIRYNLFESQLSYAFACARTLVPNGHLIHMAEKGNDLHHRILQEYSGQAVDDRWIRVVLQGGNSPVPSCSLKETGNPYRSDEETASRLEISIEDSVNGGRLFEDDALLAVYRIAADLQCNITTPSRDPLFVVRPTPRIGGVQQFVCTVTLPPGLPLQTVQGPPRFTATHSRRSGAYQVCLRLFELSCLDHRLISTPHRSDNNGHANPSFLKSDLVSGNSCYMRKRPDFWANSLRLSEERLFPVVISVGNPEGLSEPYAPIVLLTRQPLPHLQPFKLFFYGVFATVKNARGPALIFDNERLNDLHSYTLRICRTIANKAFGCSLEKMAYFVAPLLPSRARDLSYPNTTNSQDVIDWQAVTRANNNYVTRFSSDSLRDPSEFEDAVIQDRLVEFTRRCYVIRLRPDLTPMSKPSDSPREAEYANILEYCRMHRKGFQGLQDNNQPLIEVSKAAAVLNRLNPVHKPPIETNKADLIPELCGKCTIPASIYRTALLLPSITRRIDDFLIVKELNAQFFANAILEQHLLSAVFAPSATFETDYERLELLGDSFLKYFSSVYVFVFNPALSEGALHKARQHIISNKVLTQCGLSIGLPSYIQGKTFSYKLWQPPNFTVQNVQDVSPQHPGRSNNVTPSGDNAIDTKAQASVDDTNASIIHLTSQSKAKQKAHDDGITQWLGDKTIADVAEAIIGAAYLSGGRDVALSVIKALRLPVAGVEQWDDFRRKALAPPSNVTPRLREGTLSAVESIIGATFKYPHLLSQALTHGSIHGYENTCYERLEFLGDAVLDFMVIRHVFNRDDHMSPGAMTLLKSAMVSNSALAAICVRTGLHEYLLYESYALGNSIQSYVEQLEARHQEEYQRAARDGRPPGQYWLNMEPPKILSDVVESIIGALYISDGFTSDGVELIFKTILEPFYDQHITVKTLSHHPTKILFEIMQAQGCQQFSIEKEKLSDTHGTRCDVIVHDIILASATESTGYIAGRMVSTAALDALEGDPGFMAHNCSCRNRTHMGKKDAKDYKNRLEKMLADLEEGQNVTTEDDPNDDMEVI
ncbi:uncharacterized protein EDB91DRAFT_1287021 [Suillus paluster]|uniref:uncharacterized protein n=1 Tax=Suillus paluster TaxID=48578 RepID=UPI001B886FC7|nr:uncharacterized protein EDB91DRAFT_1287021 [Suillus paluster]KAG1753945.1 hypothetical protein EDB91DRAFT_1287021 [Suillus paluster]